MGQKLTGLTRRGDVWHINKQYRGHLIRCSTFQSERAAAEAVLIQKMAEIDRATDFGLRPDRRWRDAATKYLNDNLHMPSIADVAMHLEALDPFIGDLALDKIHDGTLAKFIKHRKENGNKGAGCSNRTVNIALELVIRILKLAAHKWRDTYGMTWLDKAPAISKLDENIDKRDPYPLTWQEQQIFLEELPEHIATMTLFKLNTGLREKEVCMLQWDWEVPIPELGTSVFLIPARFGGRTDKSGVKNGMERLVILNKVAKSIIETQRGNDPQYVFSYTGKGHVKGGPTYLNRMNCTAWRKARQRAAERFELKYKRKANPGFAALRVHDLKHTFGHRLRVAGVQFEDRQALLGHKSSSVTTHYSAPGIQHLIEAADRVLETDTRQLVATTILRRSA